jgi:hypothetical protein
MSFDVTIATAKARAARFATSFETEYGPAGVEKTRKEPARLTDRQADALAGFCLKHVPDHLRSEVRYNILARISGCPGDAALKSAICAAAQEVAGFKIETLRALGLTR